MKVETAESYKAGYKWVALEHKLYPEKSYRQLSREASESFGTMIGRKAVTTSIASPVVGASPKRHGPPSNYPIELEKVVVDVALLLRSMVVGFDKGCLMAYANTILKKSAPEHYTTFFPNGVNDDWYNAFMKRHSSRLQEARANTLDQDRAKWTRQG